MSEINTTIEEAEPVDNGVATRLEVDEEYVLDGELVERGVTLQFIEGGGVAVTQRVQGLTDTVTLSSDVVDAIVDTREGGDRE